MAEWRASCQMDRELIYNPWLIAAVSFVASAVIAPALFKIINRIRELYGAFSGQYLAYTFDTEQSMILLEDVRCHHRGSKISGKIYGVAYFVYDRSLQGFREHSANEGKYRFDGWIEDRQFVISYHSIIRTVHSVGSITLMSDDIGALNYGRWAGSIGHEIASAPCLWVRVHQTISSRTKRRDFIAAALRFINEAYESAELAEFSHIRKSKGTRTGKTRYMMESGMLQNVFDAFISENGGNPKDNPSGEK